ncbi:TPA: hypothetical protein ACXNIX_005845, partial [Pseudomonas aeruginosa]
VQVLGKRLQGFFRDEVANSDSAITPDDFHYLLDRGVAADCRQSSRTHLMPTCVVLSLFCRASAINLSP